MDEALPRSIETVVIGAGQAGLIMSWHLQQAGRPHVVVDRRETLGGGWQDRWDEFCLVTPNWVTSLPGFPYDGPDPDGFMNRESLVGRFRAYASAIEAPVHPATEVQALDANGGSGRRFRLTTSRGPIDADDVVVATGAYQTPKVPAASAGFPSRITQLHSHHYRNESQLATGRGAPDRLRADRGPARRGASRGRARGLPVGGALRSRPSPLSGPGLLLVAPPGGHAWH